MSLWVSLLLLGWVGVVVVGWWLLDTSARQFDRLVIAFLVLVVFGASLYGFFSGTKIDDIEQAAIVHLQVDCESQETGELWSPTGSGVIVDSKGFVLTAHHVISCFNVIASTQMKRKGIRVRIGSPKEPPDREVSVVSSDSEVDAAILKILGLPQTFTMLGLCAWRDPRPGSAFKAAGFPHGRGFQITDGILGNQDEPGGRWAAASLFASGMSGGPIIRNHKVVGLVKGGERGEPSLRLITPIQRAAKLLEQELGIKLSNCG